MKFRRNKRALAKSPGTAPGSNIYVGSRHEVEFNIEKIEFNQDRFERVTLSELPINALAKLGCDTKTWFHISGMQDSKKIVAAGEALNLHPLLIEDILNSRHRPKIEYFDSHFGVTLRI